MVEPTTTAEAPDRTEGGKFAPGNPRRFRPGVSPNPGGYDSAARAARAQATRVLVEMLRAEDAATKLAAACALLSIRPRDVTKLVSDLSAALRTPPQEEPPCR